MCIYSYSYWKYIYKMCIYGKLNHFQSRRNQHNVENQLYFIEIKNFLKLEKWRFHFQTLKNTVLETHGCWGQTKS